MVTLGMLWLPILLSAVLVFVLSAVFWMVLPFHKSDFSKLPDEEAVRTALNKKKLAPGQYRIPWCDDMKEMQQPPMMKKLEEGPVATIVVQPSGPMKMGGSMAISVLYNILVAVFVAYMAGRLLPVGAHYLAVFRVVGTATILAYCGALFYPSIWMGRPWNVTFKDLVDGVIYGLMTAGIFGWLWPR